MSIKKIVIFSISLFVLIFIILVGVLLLLTLKTVDVNYLSTLNVLADNEEQVIESGEFNYSESIFFIDKDKHIEYIEKSNPYIKVLSIESIFPNKLVIHAIERDAMFYFKTEGDEYIILDDELKVLEIKETMTNSQTNPIEIIDIDTTSVAIDLGEFLFKNNEAFRQKVYELSHELQTWDNSVANIKANIKQIEFIDALEDRLKIYSWQGVEIYIFDIDNSFSGKMYAAFSLYDSASIDRYSGEIRVLVNEVNEQIEVSYIEE